MRQLKLSEAWMCSSTTLATATCVQSKIRRSPNSGHRSRPTFLVSSIMTKAVLPYFRESRGGHIIQVTSIAGRIGPPGAHARLGNQAFENQQISVQNSTL
jgi:hypothetical protein